MYNRYIPQSDGSYRRSHIPDPPVPKPPLTAPQEHPPQPPPPSRPAVTHRPIPPRPRRHAEPTGIGSFLKQLLPKDFDTEDLLIVLLLLLMSGDCREDQNTALLTLALYLFL